MLQVKGVALTQYIHVSLFLTQVGILALTPGDGGLIYADHFPTIGTYVVFHIGALKLIEIMFSIIRI